MSKKQIVIHGVDAITKAADEGKKIEYVLLSQEADSQIINKLKKKLLLRSIPYEIRPSYAITQQFSYFKPEYVAIAIFSKINFVDTEQIFEMLSKETNNLPFVIALDGVKDPGNVGTIIRTLRAANAVGLISDNTCIIKNNRLMRNASAGAIFTLPIARSYHLAETLKAAKSHNIKILATSSHDLGKRIDLFSTKFDRPSIIVLGNEEKGISREIAEIADNLVMIPQPGDVESLNVGVAGSIILFEALRQQSINKKL